MTRRWVWAGLLLLLLVTRFAYRDIIWVEEGYPTAAARELLEGKALYRDIWFDKPPLFPAIYCLWGAQTGWPLRLAAVLFILLSCWVVERFAGLWAAALLGFFWCFDTHSAILALTPDLLMLPLHAGAVFLASRRRPFAAGILAGIALLLNSKALFVLLACLLFERSWRLLAGFILPVLLALPALSLADTWQQVWVWGALYSSDTPFADALLEGVRRTANWFGFHSALLLAAIPAWRRDWRLAAWAAIAFAAVCLGSRFFPRYYFQLLPVMVISAALGLQQMKPRWRIAVLALLLIPFARFGPRYVQMYMGEPWRDLAMFEDSRAAATRVRAAAQTGDTLLVWGYRPELFPLTGLHAGTRFLDSQPLTGVIADRHLTDSRPSAPELAAANRRQLLSTQPTWIIDGLGPYNPALDIRRYDDLAPWLAGYQLVAETPFTRVFRRR
jgi:hypothetical protein